MRHRVECLTEVKYGNIYLIPRENCFCPVLYRYYELRLAESPVLKPCCLGVIFSLSRCLQMIYKLCLLMHAVHVGRCPGYIADIVTLTSSLPGRHRLRSAAGNRYELPAIHHKLGERAFSHAGPAAWNSLPSLITATIDTETFKYRLKIYLYSLAYGL